MTRGKKTIILEDERRNGDEQELWAEQEKEKEEDQLREKKINEEEKEEKKDKEEEKKTKSELAREKKEAVPCSGKEVPYPLVSSKKDKEWHFAHFLDIFKKLEITIPCSIGAVLVGKALIDLGASINLMLLTCAEELES